MIEDSARPRAAGANRAEWASVADRWLLTARDHAVGGGALILPPGPSSQSGPVSDGIEGFARSFLLAASYLAGSAGQDPSRHAEWYARGLTAAMEPGGAGEWPRAVGPRDWPAGGITQPTVEAANLAFGLALCRAQVWDVLDEGVRERLAAWLAHHAALRVWDNNWLLFTAVIEAFLASVGVEVPGAHGAQDVERVESWYLGDGWYNDGPPESHGRNVDHYNSWVIHPFLWQWYRLRGAAEPDWRVSRFRERLGAFAETYSRLFAPDGSPLHQGRSLTYRHAVLAGLWVAGLEGVGPLSPAATRRLAGGTLRHFEAHQVGVDGPPRLGWHAPQFLPCVQEYSGPGSPYFAGMGFLGLAAAADHPLWASAEEPLRAEPARERAEVIPAIGWLVHGDPEDGIVRVVNHGSDHIAASGGGEDPHYAKFAYSTHTAPGTGAAWSDRAWTGGVDSHLALVDGWGRATRRGPIKGTATGDGYAASWHLPRLGASGSLPGARVVTASFVHGAVEVRCHLVTAPPGWAVREGGLAVAAESAPSAGTRESASGLAAWARGGGVRSAVFALAGYPGRAEVVRHVGANAMGTHSATPCLLGVPHAQSRDSIHVALHVLDRGEGTLAPAGFATAEVHGTSVTVRWAGGRERSVDLAALFPRDETEC